MARDLTGLPAGVAGLGDGLQKLRIAYATGPGGGREESVTALFNPSEIRRSRTVTWKQQKLREGGRTLSLRTSTQQFVGLDPETLSLELFFDSYEPRTDGAGLGRRGPGSFGSANPLAAGRPADVTTLTGKVTALAEVDRELHRPPICRISWGTQSQIFVGVLSQVDQRLTMFLPDGTPVRATLSCTFTEFQTRARANARELHSSDVVKTRTVRRGDSLQSLAAEEFGDPRLWPEIARANGIANARTVAPGTVLTIPKRAG